MDFWWTSGGLGGLSADSVDSADSGGLLADSVDSGGLGGLWLRAWFGWIRAFVKATDVARSIFGYMARGFQKDPEDLNAVFLLAV